MLVARVRLGRPLGRISHQAQATQELRPGSCMLRGLFWGGGAGDVGLTVGWRRVVNAWIMRKVGGSVGVDRVFLINIEAGSGIGGLGVGPVGQGFHARTDHDRIWLAVGNGGGLVLGHDGGEGGKQGEGRGKRIWIREKGVGRLSGDMY